MQTQNFLIWPESYFQWYCHLKTPLKHFQIFLKNIMTRWYYPEHLQPTLIKCPDNLYFTNLKWTFSATKVQAGTFKPNLTFREAPTSVAWKIMGPMIISIRKHSMKTKHLHKMISTYLTCSHSIFFASLLFQFCFGVAPCSIELEILWEM